jgi:hypothetical protein
MTKVWVALNITDDYEVDWIEAYDYEPVLNDNNMDLFEVELQHKK